MLGNRALGSDPCGVTTGGKEKVQQTHLRLLMQRLLRFMERGVHEMLDIASRQVHLEQGLLQGATAGVQHPMQH